MCVCVSGGRKLNCSLMPLMLLNMWKWEDYRNVNALNPSVMMLSLGMGGEMAEGDKNITAVNSVLAF